MPWVKLDDGFDEHHAIAPLSGEAVKLLVFSMTYCGRNLTDGFVAAHKAPLLSCTAKQRHIDELVTAGRWVPVDGGYQIPSFLDFNPSRAKVMDDRGQSAARQRKHRESRRDSAVTNGEVIRSRPDPTRSIRSVTNFDPDVDKAVEEPASLEVVKDTIATARTSLRSGKAS